MQGLWEARVRIRKRQAKKLFQKGHGELGHPLWHPRYMRADRYFWNRLRNRDKARWTANMPQYFHLWCHWAAIAERPPRPAGFERMIARLDPAIRAAARGFYAITKEE